MIFSDPVIDFFGLPNTKETFYPNILGAVLFGIGLALLLEYRRKGTFIGLGLGGAICINMSGGIALIFLLIRGIPNLQIQGEIILWILASILLIISIFEWIISSKKTIK
jgi:hypothetical protein